MGGFEARGSGQRCFRQRWGLAQARSGFAAVAINAVADAKREADVA